MAAQKGAATFLGASGRRYVKQFYLSDSANALATFDSGAGAGAASEAFYIPPEDVKVVDICIAAASGQTQTQLCIDGVPTGDMLLNAIHLAAITFRPVLTLGVLKGHKFTMIQIA